MFTLKTKKTIANLSSLCTKASSPQSPKKQTLMRDWFGYLCQFFLNIDVLQAIFSSSPKKTCSNLDLLLWWLEKITLDSPNGDIVMIYLHRNGKKSPKNKCKFGDAHPPLMMEILPIKKGPRDPITKKKSKQVPGDSMRPFDPLVKRHLKVTIFKGYFFSVPKWSRSQNCQVERCQYNSLNCIKQNIFGGNHSLPYFVTTFWGIITQSTNEKSRTQKKNAPPTNWGRCFCCQESFRKKLFQQLPDAPSMEYVLTMLKMLRIKIFPKQWWCNLGNLWNKSLTWIC